MAAEKEARRGRPPKRERQGGGPDPGFQVQGKASLRDGMAGPWGHLEIGRPSETGERVRTKARRGGAGARVRGARVRGRESGGGGDRKGIRRQASEVSASQRPTRWC